jgi:hypothetical protein
VLRGRVIRAWGDLLGNGEKLLPLYTAEPPLTPLRLRSVHLSRYGPTLTVRADLMKFPDLPPPQWAGADLDTLQVHVEFYDVGDLRAAGLYRPALVSVLIEPTARRRVLVHMSGDGVELRFTAADMAQVGHVSAYSLAGGLIDDGPHRYLSQLDQRLYDVVPDRTVKAYHDHL